MVERTESTQYFPCIHAGDVVTTSNEWLGDLKIKGVTSNSRSMVNESGDAKTVYLVAISYDSIKDGEVVRRNSGATILYFEEKSQLYSDVLYERLVAQIEAENLFKSLSYEQQEMYREVFKLKSFGRLNKEEQEQYLLFEPSFIAQEIDEKYIKKLKYDRLMAHRRG